MLDCVKTLYDRSNICYNTVQHLCHFNLDCIISTFSKAKQYANVSNAHRHLFIMYPINQLVSLCRPAPFLCLAPLIALFHFTCHCFFGNLIYVCDTNTQFLFFLVVDPSAVFFFLSFHLVIIHTFGLTKIGNSQQHIFIPCKQINSYREPSVWVITHAFGVHIWGVGL